MSNDTSRDFCASRSPQYLPAIYDANCTPGVMTVDQAQFLALWLETLLFGVFSVLYAICLWVLLHNRKPWTSNALMFGSCSLMYILASMHIAIDLFRGVEAFFLYPEGPIAFNLLLGHWSFKFKTGIYIALTVVSDSFLVYRCYIIWSQSLAVVAFPLLLVVGNTVTGTVALQLMTKINLDTTTVFNDDLTPWMKAYFAFTVVTNGLATGLIAFRIMRTSRPIPGARYGLDIWNVAIVLLESGMIYTISLITLIIVYLSRSSAQNIVLDAITPIIGIVFTSIIIRVGLRAPSGTFDLDTEISVKTPAVPPTPEMSRSVPPLSHHSLSYAGDPYDQSPNGSQNLRVRVRQSFSSSTLRSGFVPHEERGKRIDRSCSPSRLGHELEFDGEEGSVAHTTTIVADSRRSSVTLERKPPDLEAERPAKDAS